MRAMILAAGRGKRLRPMTDTLPKPLLEVGGKPLIAWHLDRLAAAGCQDVVINLSWLGERIRDAIGDGSRYGLRVHYSEEGSPPLETGGGIARALPLLGTEPFAVINGDVFTDFPFDRLVLPDGSLAHLVLVPNPPHHPDGDFGIADGHATLTAPRFTFSGIGVYRAEFFEGSEEGAFPLAPLLKRAIIDHRVTAEVWKGVWDDVGTVERYRALTRRVAADA